MCTRHRYFDLRSDPYETNDLLAGGDVSTSARSSNCSGLRSYLRGTLAPNWLPRRACAA